MPAILLLTPHVLGLSFLSGMLPAAPPEEIFHAN